MTTATTSRCPFIWRAPSPWSKFAIDHRCGRDTHTDDRHACICGATHQEDHQ